MNKKITLIGINYYPEDSSTGLYSSQMMEYLSDKGCDVDVITGFPYYPQWQIWDSYQNKPKFLDEKNGDINIHRYRQYVPKKPSFAKRILHLSDFTLGSIRNLFKVKKCDLVIAVVPFTTSILLGVILAKMRGAKLWVHIQDFEFDAARESGLSSGGGFSTKIFGGLMKIESLLLKKADIVSTISYSMIQKLKTKTKTPTYFLPNWVDPNDISPESSKTHEFLKSDKFKILYSGNIGAKQDWEFFIKVVEHYKTNNNIEFIVVGDGATKSDLVAKTSHLNNVVHHLPIDFADLSDLLCSANLHILFQKSNIIDTVMPSKILGMMASAKPSIVTGNLESESKNLFNTSNGGYFFDSEDLSSVLNKIDELQDNHNLCDITGKNARKYIISQFSKDKVLGLFAKEIDEIIN